MARKTTTKATLELDGLNFDNVKSLVSIDTADLSPEQLLARHNTLMDRLLAKQLARRVTR
jgi:hypothetical protein